MKYATILKYADEYQIRMMCRALGVCASSYYHWRKGKASLRARSRVELDAEVRAAFESEKARAGAPRLTRRLKAQGHVAGHNQVAQSLRRQGLRAKAARKFKATTNSNHALPVSPNLLNQDFSAQRCDEKWVSDDRREWFIHITYIDTAEGWLYLAVVMDVCSRAIVGWSMSQRMTARLTCDALKMAVSRRHRPCGVIVHSDRGSQYCAQEYRMLLERHGLISSMSARGNCYDNAAMESWNHSLKVEAVHGARFATREEAKKEVFEYIEIYYNRQRMHSALNYLSPMQFELSKVA